MRACLPGFQFGAQAAVCALMTFFYIFKNNSISYK